MLNSFIGMGRFTKDPEMRTTNNGKFVTTFTLAIDRDYDRDKTDFVQCVAWDRTAEFVNRYFQKGQLAVVAGSFQSREWTDKSGNSRQTWEVIVQKVYFAEGKKSTSIDVAATDFDDLDDDEEVPF